MTLQVFLSLADVIIRLTQAKYTVNKDEDSVSVCAEALGNFDDFEVDVTSEESSSAGVAGIHEFGALFCAVFHLSLLNTPEPQPFSPLGYPISCPRTPRGGHVKYTHYWLLPQ